MNVPLSRIAYARSGEKGDSINIGVAARAPEFYDTLVAELTTERVKARFSDICKGEVHRYELPNLHGLNFILEESLDGGGTRCLRLDHQGKTACDGLIGMEIAVADELLEG